MIGPNTELAHDDRLMRIRRGGLDIEGRWAIDGDEVRVECCYGTDHAPFDGAPPTRVAELLLARLAFVALSSRGQAAQFEPDVS